MPESVFPHDRRSTVRISTGSRDLEVPFAPRTQKGLNDHWRDALLFWHYQSALGGWVVIAASKKHSSRETNARLV